MITPIVQESTWLSVLQTHPLFDPGTEPVVVVSPHPDDETLATGGLIAALRQRGIPVSVIAVTDGENAYGKETTGLGETRRGEQAAALKELGVNEANLIRLGVTDSDVMSQRERLVNLLASHICENAHVLAPWIGDFHPDHEACGWAAKQATQQVGARLSWYFFWTWHRGTPSLLDGMKLGVFPLNDEWREAKLRALAQHQSQLEHYSGEPILPANLLAPARRSFEVFAIS